MKISVIKNEHGKVVATFEHALPGGPSVKPVLRPGHTVQEVEAPENYKTNIKEFYKHHSR